MRRCLNITICRNLVWWKLEYFTGSDFHKKRLPQNSNSFQNYIACLQQQVFLGSIIHARAHFQGAKWKTAGILKPPSPYMNLLNFGWDVFGDLWSTLSPPDSPVALDDNLRLVSCNCNTACQSVQCSCSKADLYCTKFCWCKGDMECVNPSTFSTHALDID